MCAQYAYICLHVHTVDCWRMPPVNDAYILGTFHFKIDFPRNFRLKFAISGRLLILARSAVKTNIYKMIRPGVWYTLYKRMHKIRSLLLTTNSLVFVC